MKRRRALLVLVLTVTLSAAHAQPEKWPAKPVRMVVPLAPGGSTDIVARMLAARLSEEFGQLFISDNRAGAGGAVGAEIAARANPDGYTVITVPASYAANAALYKLPYDPVKGIAPIAMVAIGPLILTVHPSVQATNLKEFIDRLRAEPGALNFGSSGSGSFSHLVAELFRQMTKTDMVHVPYKGAGPALVDLLGGQIQIFFGAGPSTAPHIRSGKLRGIAVTTGTRSPVMPDLPAIGEMIPGYSVNFWYGVWAPAGTPGEIISRLNQALARILKQSDMQGRLRADGVEPAHSTPEEFARVITRDIAVWAKVVKAGNIKVD